MVVEILGLGWFLVGDSAEYPIWRSMCVFIGLSRFGVGVRIGLWGSWSLGFWIEDIPCLIIISPIC